MNLILRHDGEEMTSGCDVQTREHSLDLHYTYLCSSAADSIRIESHFSQQASLSIQDISLIGTKLLV